MGISNLMVIPLFSGRTLTFLLSAIPDIFAGLLHVDPDGPGREDNYKLFLYGSMKEYWTEVSYGNLNVQPYQTWSGAADKYHTGIVNQIDSTTTPGKKFIKWITLDSNRIYYEGYSWAISESIKSHTYNKLRFLHSLPTSDPRRIEFDIDSYLVGPGKIGIIGAGGFDGARFGGFADLRKQFVNSEKTFDISKYTGTILTQLFTQAHEFGHTIGLYHYQGGAYELMHWGGLRGIYHNCPPHINPWSKLVFGWIMDSANVIRVRSDSIVSLPPIDSIGRVAVVTVYGDAGRDNLWDGHSEYFIIENRQRSGFNRFTGGEAVPPNFTGGALVWYFSQSDLFPSIGNFTNGTDNRLSLKVYNYPYIRYSLGDAMHFYPYQGTYLDETTNPNSYSRSNLRTGISLNNFSLISRTINVRVNYQLGAPPLYNHFIHDKTGTQIEPLGGTIYINVDNIRPTIFQSGSIIQIHQKENIHGRINALGTDLAPIIFEGVGFQSYRTVWAGIEITPSSSFPSPRKIEFVTFIDAARAILINAQSTASINFPIVRNNSFVNCGVDIEIIGRPDDFLSPYDISGLDSNTFTKFKMSGHWKLSSADSFIVPSGASLEIVNPVSESAHNDLMIENNKKLIIKGNLVITGDVLISGSGKIEIYPGGQITIRESKKLTIGADISLVYHNTGNIIWESSSQILNYGSIYVKDNATFPVGSNGTLLMNPLSKFFFSDASTLNISGKLKAFGSLNQRITFTSSSSTPQPGDWGGIVFSGGGPDTLTYCNIKYAENGIRFINTAPNSYMEYDTVSNSSGFGVSVSSTGASSTALRIYKSAIRDNRTEGIRVNFARVNVSNSRIENNGAATINSGIFVTNAGRLFIDSSFITNNIGSGIDVSGNGSRVSLSPDEIKRGYNTITGHGLSEIYVRNSASALLGYRATINYCICEEDPLDKLVDQFNEGSEIVSKSPACPPGCFPTVRYESRAGWNNVTNNFTYNCRLINNATAITVQARYNYWGTGSSMFCGPVDTLSQLGSPVNTPAKLENTDIYAGEQFSKEDRAKMREWLLQLKSDIELNNTNSIDALYQLALYVGPGGEYSDALEMPWEFLLTSVERNSRLSNVKSLASVFLITAKMERGEFSNAIYIADQILRRNNDDNMWFFCQTQKVIANVGLGNITNAISLFNAMKSRGEKIDKKSIEVLDDYLKNVSSTTNSNVKMSDNNIQTVQNINIEDSNIEHPKTYSLEQCYPNPFNPVTQIKFSIPEAGFVTLRVYDVLGREVEQLVNEYKEAGYYNVSFNAIKLPSGVYIYRLQAGKFYHVRKMILLR